MTSVGTKKRHCDSCAKNVTDLTGLSDRQLLKFISESDGHFCGRFRPDQLDRTIREPTPSTGFRKWLAAGLGMVLASGGLMAQSENNTKRIPPLHIDSQTISAEQEVTKTHLIEQLKSTAAQTVHVTGTVTEEDTNDPLIGAEILIFGTRTGTVTGLDGDFSLFAPAGTKLVVAYTGFNSTTVTLSDKKEQVINPTLATGMYLGKMIVTGIVYSKPRTLFGNLKNYLRNRTYGRDARREERKGRREARQAIRDQREEVEVITKSTSALTKTQPQFTVSPNPTSGPIRLAFNGKAKQKVMLEVVNAVGKPVLLRPWKLVPGENVLTLNHSEWGVGKGTFIIRIVDRKDQVVTTRLLVF